MKKIFGLLIIILFSCDNEIPIEDNFVVEAFLFQGEKVDDVRIKETKLWNSEYSIDTYIGNANIKIYGNGSESWNKIKTVIQKHCLSQKNTIKDI